jgi:hypothetical protein
MCKNMVVFVVCAVSSSLVFSFWRSVCNFLKYCVQFLVKQKGDAPTKRASRILVKGDAPTECASCIFVKGDAHCAGASTFYLICKKMKAYKLFSTGMLLVPTQHAHWYAYVKVRVPTDTCRPGVRSTVWSKSCLKYSKLIDCCGFKR